MGVRFSRFGAAEEPTFPLVTTFRSLPQGMFEFVVQYMCQRRSRGAPDSYIVVFNFTIVDPWLQLVRMEE